MANFQTHLNGGIVVSAATTLTFYTAGLIRGEETLPLFTIGVVGSLLPDIDSDTSKPVKALFSVLGAGLAFVMTLPLADRFQPLELALIWVGVYLCVRYGFFEVFTRLTVHRGIWHSWLAAAAAALATTNAAYWLWHQTPETAWIAGMLMAIGYLTHLCLDELSSVDFSNSRLRSSFGSALKPFSLANPWSSLGMLAVVAFLALQAPAANLSPALDRLETLVDLTAAADFVRDRLEGFLAQARAW